MNIALLYVTYPNQTEASAAVDTLLAEKLIACANFFPITSSLYWQGEKSVGNEVVALMKTSTDRAAEVEARVLGLHSYDVPCVLQFPVQANKDYATWIQNTVE